MTGLLLAFTGWAVTITNQYDKPYCVAHAVATCGSLYGYDSKPETYLEKLGIGDNGYRVENLPQALYRMRISKPKIYTREEAKEILKKGPTILNIAQHEVDIYNGEKWSWHAVCAVGYNDNHIIIAQSKGTGRGYQGYGVIASGDIQFVTLQTLGSKALTPSLILLTEKKESLQEFKQVVKSPTIKKRNTRKRFLKPLD